LNEELVEPPSWRKKYKRKVLLNVKFVHGNPKFWYLKFTVHEFGFGPFGLNLRVKNVPRMPGVGLK
jgi:hypothetical protein